MRFTKKISYKLSKPVAMMALAGASLFAGCSKDDDKGLEPEPKTKTTTYVFRPFVYENLTNLDQIKASADSVEVSKIIFRALNTDIDGDSTSAWAGVNLRGVYNASIPALEAAKGKGQMQGTLKNVTEAPVNREFAPKLEALGLKVIFEAKAASQQKAR